MAAENVVQAFQYKGILFGCAFSEDKANWSWGIAVVLGRTNWSIPTYCALDRCDYAF